MLLSFLLAVFLTLWGTSCAAASYRCACATSNLNLRSGAGTSFGVISILTSQHCLPHEGDSRIGRFYTWLRLDLQGQSVWAASNWLNIETCHGNNDDAQLPGCPRIVTRSEWGARAPSSPIDHMAHLPEFVFIHHGDAGACWDEESCKGLVRAYQNYHMDSREWSDIGYSFLVGEDGNAYEGRGWSEIGAHTKGYNSVGIGICFLGNFTSVSPNGAAMYAAQKLIQCGLDNGKISPHYTLKGHRDVGSTNCPGDPLYHIIHGWPHYVSGDHRYSESPPTIVG